MENQVENSLDIAAVERETGLSKDVLRKWERRYGFPAPLRDDRGERAYPVEQVDRLRQIRRLLDAGMRPARAIQVDAGQASAAPDEVMSGRAGNPLDGLDLRDPATMRQQLRRDLLRVGVARFVLDTLVPLNDAVGETWARGRLDIHEEHVYTDVVQGVLRGIIGDLGDGSGSPRILLTTLPEEQHGLGILMAAALFSLDGAFCISLGTQTPVREIVQAARAHRVDVVALSFSGAYPRRRIQPALEELRRQLDGHLELWAGGEGVAKMAPTGPGLRFPPTLEAARSALADWRHGYRKD